MEQRLTFDQIADLYQAARPGYPQMLYDDIVSRAGLKSGDAILEVGCGTGQATRGFAMRGFPIVALDPGPELIRVAREALRQFENVELVESTFEAWRARPMAFRLLIAAQSWHWVAPSLRFAKAAETLSADGFLAVFGHVPVGLPAPLVEELKPIYLRHTGVWGAPPEVAYLPAGPFKQWFDESGYFGPVSHSSYAWKLRHNADSYTNWLGTRSDFRLLSPTIRDELRRAIFEAIARLGGEFDMEYETHSYMARRAA